MFLCVCVCVYISQLFTRPTSVLVAGKGRHSLSQGRRDVVGGPALTRKVCSLHLPWVCVLSPPPWCSQMIHYNKKIVGVGIGVLGAG